MDLFFLPVGLSYHRHPWTHSVQLTATAQNLILPKFISTL